MTAITKDHKANEQSLLNVLYVMFVLCLEFMSALQNEGLILSPIEKNITINEALYDAL